MVAFAGSPQNQREDGEEQNKSQEQAKVKPNVAAGILNGVFVFLVIFGLMMFVKLPPGGELSGVFERGREARGGGFAGMMNWRGMVLMITVMVGRTHRTRPVWHFLSIMVRWALHVVQWPARWPRQRQLVHASHLGVWLGVHFRSCH